MKKLILVVILAVLASVPALFAQADKPEVRRGNREFSRGHFSQADIHYRKALLADSLSIPAAYNLANALYRQENLEEAGRVMEGLQSRVLETGWAAYWWFNTGDIALGTKNYARAADAFKEVLKLEPDNMEAKENYIYARMMQKNQEQQQQQNQDQNQNQDQDQNNEDQEEDQNQNQDNQDQNGGGQEQQPQDGEQPQMTPQQIQQILKAIQAKEQETQDKVNKEKADAMRSRQRDRNW